MSRTKIRVGIVGLQPGRSWAAAAHLPALRYLHDDFEVVGVANSRIASSQAAANACGIPRAFRDADELVASCEIDVVVVTVRVPAHYEIVRAALNAGKHVYCEWPLGRTLDEAIELANLARERGVVAVAGSQSRVAPAIATLKRLIAGGYVGEVVSTSVTGWGRIWGPTISDLDQEGYLLKRENGATMLTIPFAHTVAAFQEVLGGITEVMATLDTRYTQVLATQTGEWVAADAPDHVVVAGHLANGAPVSMHFQGGEPRGIEGFVWDIHGTLGDLRVTGPTGHTQLVPLNVKGARGDDRILAELSIDSDGVDIEDGVPGNVARVYRRLAADLRNGTRSAPTFDDAVSLHQLLSAIEQSAQAGSLISVSASNRQLPDIAPSET
jgi:predicted dehydrogenase